MRIAAVVFLSLLLLPLKLFAAEPEGVEKGSIRVIEISDAGVYPRELDITSSDLFVFLLNGSKESLVSFQIDYGTHSAHCVNDNIKDFPDGTARSVAPLAPRDFATPCFHEPGTYPIKFFGVPGKSEPVVATVILK